MSNKMLSAGLLSVILSVGQPAIASPEVSNVQGMTREAAELCIRNYSKPKEERRECAKVALSYSQADNKAEAQIMLYSTFVNAVFEKVFGVDNGYGKKLFDTQRDTVLSEYDGALDKKLEHYRDVFNSNDKVRIKQALIEIQRDLRQYENPNTKEVYVATLKKIDVNIEGILRRMG